MGGGGAGSRASAAGGAWQWAPRCPGCALRSMLRSPSRPAIAPATPPRNATQPPGAPHLKLFHSSVYSTSLSCGRSVSNDAVSWLMWRGPKGRTECTTVTWLSPCAGGRWRRVCVWSAVRLAAACKQGAPWLQPASTPSTPNRVLPFHTLSSPQQPQHSPTSPAHLQAHRALVLLHAQRQVVGEAAPAVARQRQPLALHHHAADGVLVLQAVVVQRGHHVPPGLLHCTGARAAAAGRAGVSGSGRGTSWQ